MRRRGFFSLFAASIAAVAVVSASGAATTHAQKVARIDVSTRTAVVHYLRSIHVNPAGVVIQRGARNYAGPSCPGKGWSCTTTSHPVVQVASAGGQNTFRCATSSCAVVQVSAAAAKPNAATCVKTTGLGASCSITQSSSGTVGNTAKVWEDAGKLTGLTQTAVYSASIKQTTSGSGPNLACVHQAISIDGSTGKNNTTAANVTLEAHQSVLIAQDSATGGNTAENATNPSTGVYQCDASPVSQNQTLTSSATSKGPITQNENKANSGANMTIDIEQNQGTGFFGTASGANSADFNQTNTLTAVANSPAGVSQTQSSVNGGLLGTINQDSSDPSTATATQTETQCEDGATSGLTSCDTADPDASEAPSSLTQIQYGPVQKGVGTATQTGAPGTFSVSQTSTQDTDQGTGSQQTNVVHGDCSTPGTCTADQTTIVNGTKTQDTQSGQNVNSTVNCTGSTCTATPPASPNVLIAGTGDFSDPTSTEPNDNLAQALTNAGYTVTESPTLPPDLSSFGQVWWVDSLNPPTSAEQSQLIAFEQSGKGVFLTGERPCCETLNTADTSMVNAMVTGGGVTVGGQGDVCGCNSPLPVNPTVVGNLATQPHTVTSWQPNAPGGMAGVPDSSVFAYYQPGDISTRQVVAAAWDRSSTVGNGRVVVLMDINWPEVGSRAANWSDVAENVAFFLSSPASPPVLQTPIMGLSLYTAPQMAPARAATSVALGGTTSTR